jgi:hypothetical protein
MKARCQHCGEKPARKLKLPGSYGQYAFFCSMRCAAKAAIQPSMIRDMQWCMKHSFWFDNEDDPCYECEREAREAADDEVHKRCAEAT